jgi:hypothetical protein
MPVGNSACYGESAMRAARTEKVEICDSVVATAKHEGCTVIYTTLPPVADPSSFSHLMTLLNEKGFEEGDRLIIDHRPSFETMVIIQLKDNPSKLQTTLFRKDFIDCLVRSGVVQKPMLTTIHKRLAEHCMFHYH